MAVVWVVMPVILNRILSRVSSKKDYHPRKHKKSGLSFRATSTVPSLCIALQREPLKEPDVQETQPQ